MLTKWQFKFDGIWGRVETYEDGAYIWWGGMGFHLAGAGEELRAAVLKAHDKKLEEIRRTSREYNSADEERHLRCYGC